MHDGTPCARGFSYRLPLALLALGVLQAPSAFAYIDPNSAGPLSQMLFPLLIAIASVLAAMRRIIRQSWLRVYRATAAILRHAIGRGESPMP